MLSYPIRPRRANVSLHNSFRVVLFSQRLLCFVAKSGQQQDLTAYRKHIRDMAVVLVDVLFSTIKFNGIHDAEKLAIGELS